MLRKLSSGLVCFVLFFLQFFSSLYWVLFLQLTVLFYSCSVLHTFTNIAVVFTRHFLKLFSLSVVQYNITLNLYCAKASRVSGLSMFFYLKLHAYFFAWHIVHCSSTSHGAWVSQYYTFVDDV